VCVCVCVCVCVYVCVRTREREKERECARKKEAGLKSLLIVANTYIHMHASSCLYAITYMSEYIYDLVHILNCVFMRMYLNIHIRY